VPLSLPTSLIVVRAFWDADAAVWVGTTDDVPGLATEASTLEALRDKVVVMIPELMEANAVASDLPEIPIQIIAELGARVPNPNHNPGPMPKVAA
jgi:hypothetical protein